MNNITRLNNRFCSMDLYYGKVELKPSHRFICFFIIEHESDDAFIEEQVLKLSLSLGGEYVFYGKNSDKWSNTFKEKISQIYHNNTEIDLMYEHIGDYDIFIEKIKGALSSRSIVPYDIFLIYDNKHLYETTIKHLSRYI